MSTRQAKTLDQTTTVVQIAMSGPHEISIQGNFSGPATVTHTSFDSVEGAGATIRTPSTAAVAYKSTSPHEQFTVTGADGSTDIKVIAKAINSLGRG